VTPRDYYLIVSRLVPENSLEEMMEGFARSQTNAKLVVVGSANYENAFHARLRSIAAGDSRISMVGHVSDQDVLKELWCNCHAYLHGHSVGGRIRRSPRDGIWLCGVSRDTVFNREVLDDAGVFFTDASEMATRMRSSTPSPTRCNV
jgi:glycosyltransferase involved in cell wall biosynthesis